ncbi:MAG: NAD(P)H-hydrate dehydratase [Lachnospiraceae bacterium]|nr:NAD(P)H-hydrate dehydratase [Lachnospiraceae bacterium]
MTGYGYAATGEEMKRIDSYTIESVGIPAAVLMERAALFVAEAVMRSPGRANETIAVCGTGNNGGDAVCAARILHCKGYRASIYLVESDSGKYSEGLKLQLEIAKKVGVPFAGDIPDREGLTVIDGLFGTGLKRDVTGAYSEAVQKINALKSSKVFCVDIPSGINSATGQVLGTAVRADHTLTFGLPKLGMILFPGREYSGNVTVCDIGFPDAAVSHAQPAVRFVKKASLPVRVKDSNKGTYGRVLVIAGHGMASGAAILAAKAAYKAGAGLVKVLTGQKSAQAVLEAVPECVVGVYEDEGRILKDEITGSIGSSDVLAFGMGIGTDETAEKLFETVMEAADIPMVLDADGLNLLAKKGLSRADFKKEVALTPHLKELSRLIGKDVGEIKANLTDIAGSFSKREGFTLVMKDAATLIASPEGVFVNTSGNDGMSTGGSGDVLAGVIASFAAQGLPLSEAARQGVFLHGVAGDIAAGKLGRHAMLAGDLADALAQAVKLAEG